MKFTNINNLIINFIGGGLIKFPSRFLKWIKVDGDSEEVTPQPEPTPEPISKSINLHRFCDDWTPSTADNVNTVPFSLKRLLSPKGEYGFDTYKFTDDDYVNYVTSLENRNKFEKLYPVISKTLAGSEYPICGFNSWEEMIDYADNLISEYNLIEDKTVYRYPNASYYVKYIPDRTIYLTACDNDTQLSNINNFYIVYQYDYSFGENFLSKIEIHFDTNKYIELTSNHIQLEWH